MLDDDDGTFFDTLKEKKKMGGVKSKLRHSQISKAASFQKLALASQKEQKKKCMKALDALFEEAAKEGRTYVDIFYQNNTEAFTDLLFFECNMPELVREIRNLLLENHFFLQEMQSLSEDTEQLCPPVHEHDDRCFLRLSFLHTTPVELTQSPNYPPDYVSL